jgi:hypothetical protein
MDKCRIKSGNQLTIISLNLFLEQIRSLQSLSKTVTMKSVSPWHPIPPPIIGQGGGPYPQSISRWNRSLDFEQSLGSGFTWTLMSYQWSLARGAPCCRCRITGRGPSDQPGPPSWHCLQKDDNSAGQSRRGVVSADALVQPLRVFWRRLDTQNGNACGEGGEHFENSRAYSPHLQA